MNTVCMKYNVNKGRIMIVRNGKDKKPVFSSFFLSGVVLRDGGHCITTDLSDDKDYY